MRIMTQMCLNELSLRSVECAQITHHFAPFGARIGTGNLALQFGHSNACAMGTAVLPSLVGLRLLALFKIVRSAVRSLGMDHFPRSHDGRCRIGSPQLVD